MTRKATVHSTVENPPGRMGAEWLSDAAVRSVFTGVVALFSLHAALRMAQDIFPAYSVPQKGLVWIQALAVFFILFYETGIPALQRAVRELVKSRGETSARLVRKLCVLGTPVVFDGAVTVMRSHARLIWRMAPARLRCSSWTNLTGICTLPYRSGREKSSGWAWRWHFGRL